ncbi:hypothetical protein BC628DRAFT_866884 [Trametes gibbosa]|nr:hypothetical protein BC628DRAFT_866884 [Trametes gibbosa]
MRARPSVGMSHGRAQRAAEAQGSIWETYLGRVMVEGCSKCGTGETSSSTSSRSPRLASCRAPASRTGGRTGGRRCGRRRCLLRPCSFYQLHLRAQPDSVRSLSQASHSSSFTESALGACRRRVGSAQAVKEPEHEDTSARPHAGGERLPGEIRE